MNLSAVTHLPERREGAFVYFKDVLVNRVNRKNKRSITSKQIIKHSMKTKITIHLALKS